MLNVVSYPFFKRKNRCGSRHPVWDMSEYVLVNPLLRFSERGDAKWIFFFLYLVQLVPFQVQYVLSILLKMTIKTDNPSIRSR